METPRPGTRSSRAAMYHARTAGSGGSMSRVIPISSTIVSGLTTYSSAVLEWCTAIQSTTAAASAIARRRKAPVVMSAASVREGLVPRGGRVEVGPPPHDLGRHAHAEQAHHTTATAE